MRVAALASLHLRWGIGGRHQGDLGYYAAGLPATVERTMGSVTTSFVGGRGGHLPARPEVADAAARLARLREAVAEIDPEAAATGPSPPDFEPFLGRCEFFLRELARQHGYAHRPLLAPEPVPRD